MQNIIDRLIDDFHEREFPELMPRHQALVRAPRKANVVIGMRRSGKTWFCFQQMQELVKSGIEKERLLHLNFENERLLPFSARDFQTVLDTYYRKFPAFKNEQCYLFLDEVQRIDGWDKFVHRVLDTEKIAVHITGSSSKLLSKEIATGLRGRTLTTEIFPFSFKEFLTFRNIQLKFVERFGSKIRALLQNHIGQYLEIGGFPEVQNFESELRRDVLQNYLDVVILRDVVERHAVQNTVALRALIRHVMSAPATRFSVNKFYNTLRSQGIACTKNNLYDYLDHLVDAFVFYKVPIHVRSERVRQVNPSKVYVIDPGLLEAMSLHMTEDRGALLENLVYMQLRRQGHNPEYYFTKNSAEIDFVLAADNRRRRQLIQVCWTIRDPRTREREVGALLSGMEELGLKRGTLITWLDEESPDDRIDVVPAWRWLLST
jgi:predicted AAA+ superfamily ATPase